MLIWQQQGFDLDVHLRKEVASNDSCLFAISSLCELKV